MIVKNVGRKLLIPNLPQMNNINKKDVLRKAYLITSFLTEEQFNQIWQMAQEDIISKMDTKDIFSLEGNYLNTVYTMYKKRIIK